MISLGLTNALGSFKDYVNKILAEKLDIFVKMIFLFIPKIVERATSKAFDGFWKFSKNMAFKQIWRSIISTKMRSDS